MFVKEGGLRFRKVSDILLVVKRRKR